MGLLRILTGDLRTVGARPQLPHVTANGRHSPARPLAAPQPAMAGRIRVWRAPLLQLWVEAAQFPAFYGRASDGQTAVSAALPTPPDEAVPRDVPGAAAALGLLQRPEGNAPGRAGAVAS